MLEKLGHHIQVLSIYIYKMNDVNSAIKYCDKVYTSKDKNSDRVKSSIFMITAQFHFVTHPRRFRYLYLPAAIRFHTSEITNYYCGLILP